MRADYYRELRHCRSLPENDEMLRICGPCSFWSCSWCRRRSEWRRSESGSNRSYPVRMKLFRTSVNSVTKHQAQLDQRLRSSRRISPKALNPEAVAATINESLRQQFVKSTIPETADALAVAAAQIKKATAEFVRAARTLGDAYNGAAEEARSAIDHLESTCSQASAAPNALRKSWCVSFARNIVGRCMRSRPRACSLASGSAYGSSIGSNLPARAVG